MHPALGRSFTEPEGTPGGGLVVMISHSLWSRRFASDPNAVGQAITLDGRDYTVIGVTGEGFRFDFPGPRLDIFLPRVFELNELQAAQIQMGAGYLNYVARLRPGVSIGRAQAEMDALAAQYRAQRPGSPDANSSIAVHVGNLRDETVSGVRAAILILFGAVSVVLLIACANVASLLLSRALGRQKEIAVRTALGATRSGLIRQLLTESLLLSLVGGACGTLLASWGTRAVAALAAASLPHAREIHTDGYVLGFTLLVSVVCGVFFGLVPALQVSRPDLVGTLRSEGRGSTAGPRRNAVRNLLVVSQVALSLLLVIGAGLLIRNFLQLRNLRLGFDPGHLLTLNIALPTARYSRSQDVDFFAELCRRVRPLPGVRAAAVTSSLPLNTLHQSPALPEDYPVVPPGQRPLFNIEGVTPGYLDTIRASLLRGRDFTDHDGAKDPPVIIVNEILARTYWPNQNPIGKHILVGRQVNAAEVVGVVADIRNRGLSADANPEILFPFAQLSWPFMNLVVRTQSDPHTVVQAVRAQVASLDRDQPVTAVQSMDEVLADGASQPRFTTYLLGALAATAFLLALVGIYGVIAYSVAERTQEMGIRMALGANRADILRLVLRQGLLLALMGIGIGLAAALALTGYLASLLYRVSVTDPATSAAALLFAAIAVLASYIPARRATQVDPAVTLR
ncbi:MAG: ABC transporter permease [Candidatus Sulfopaludibacter sp.]|nr:ABC transporter permease [Candidatus Sulfopaludibacter sp.]